MFFCAFFFNLHLHFEVHFVKKNIMEKLFKFFSPCFLKILSLNNLYPPFYLCHKLFLYFNGLFALKGVVGFNSSVTIFVN